VPEVRKQVRLAFDTEALASYAKQANDAEMRPCGPRPENVGRSHCPPCKPDNPNSARPETLMGSSTSTCDKAVTYTLYRIERRQMAVEALNDEARGFRSMRCRSGTGGARVGRQFQDDLDKRTAGLPNDVAAVLTRHVVCFRWFGEEPYDKARARQIERAIRQNKCDSSWVTRPPCASATPTIQRSPRLSTRPPRTGDLVACWTGSSGAVPKRTAEARRKTIALGPHHAIAGAFCSASRGADHVADVRADRQLIP